MTPSARIRQRRLPSENLNIFDSCTFSDRALMVRVFVSFAHTGRKPQVTCACLRMPSSTRTTSAKFVGAMLQDGGVLVVNKKSNRSANSANSPRRTYRPHMTYLIDKEGWLLQNIARTMHSPVNGDSDVSHHCGAFSLLDFQYRVRWRSAALAARQSARLSRRRRQAGARENRRRLEQTPR